MTTCQAKGQISMSNQDLEALFNFLKKIQEKQEDMSDALIDIKINFSLLNENSKTLSARVDGMLEKCRIHETDLKKAGDFMLVHETKEKSVLGIRTDFVAWLGLIAAIVAVWANLDKIFN